jgi:hypothetical protein
MKKILCAIIATFIIGFISGAARADGIVWVDHGGYLSPQALVADCSELGLMEEDQARMPEACSPLSPALHHDRRHVDHFIKKRRHWAEENRLAEHQGNQTGVLH